MITPSTIEELLDYWPGHVPFKGSLVSEDGSCMCAQGQALHFLGGLTVDELRCLDQEMADKQVAELFGISLAHSVLLRRINDGQEGAPTCVIRNPEQVLGDQAQTVLTFWRHLDRMTPADWKAAREAARAAAREAARAAAREAARAAATARAAAWAAAGAAAEEAAGAAAEEAAGAAAEEAAGEAAREAARAAAREAARAAAWEAAWEAAGATREIQGAAVMRAKNQPFFFLPLFGFADPEAVMLLDAAEAVQ